MTVWRDKRSVTLTIPAELVSNVRIAIEARAKEFKETSQAEYGTMNGTPTDKRWNDMIAGLTRLAEQLK